MVCNDKNHYVGGTSKGREFLSSNPHLAASFLTSTKQGITPTPPEPSNRKELRASVQDQLNAKYSLAVGDPHAKVPYRHLRPQHVIGLPRGVTLSHPTAMCQEHLELVHSNVASIKFVGVPPSTVLTEEHSYTKPTCTTSSGDSSAHQATGYTTLSVKGTQESVGPLESESTTPTVTTAFGRSVQLLSKNYTVVGSAIVMAGDDLHGHKIPPGYSKVCIQQISDTEQWIQTAFDEPLAPGSFTAWPLNRMKGF